MLAMRTAGFNVQEPVLPTRVLYVHDNLFIDQRA